MGAGHQIGLELLEVHIEGIIKMHGGSDTGHNLASELVEVQVARMLSVQVAVVEIIDASLSSMKSQSNAPGQCGWPRWSYTVLQLLWTTGVAGWIANFNLLFLP